MGIVSLNGLKKPNLLPIAIAIVAVSLIKPRREFKQRQPDKFIEA
ncbi:hypothetical protein H1P_2730007 [Hyella patelloides LEGE 07179]|uniref:Uncharacterized protein n=1 Tax=Hyella patelloides LEGE 07179 TaxID=945734 RepID=A0A563VSZ6_9CYAN|nr:hypothetical protein [Hyella patelloides]VEP14592.1 hypothetical protein H1P_2730007 [Hyella patelloides LEGE 07179]